MRSKQQLVSPKLPIPLLKLFPLALLHTRSHNTHCLLKISIPQSPYLCIYIFLKIIKKNKLNMEKIILDLGFYSSISQYHREKKRMIIYVRITWFALTVRMFAPSSLIGIIAASSHKACRSLPEYPA